MNENDISLIESTITPIFKEKDEKNKQYKNEIRTLLISAMQHAGVNPFRRNVFWWYVNRTITTGLKKGLPLKQIEETLRKFIRSHVDPEKDKKASSYVRVKRSFGLVKEYISPSYQKVLDLGAGDGLLALEIKEQLNKEVLLIDVVDYNYTDLPLILYTPEESLPLSNDEVDLTILFTVLHHASDPEHLLAEATRVTKSRLVIIEAYADEKDIRIVNSFLDWFYNRVIGDEDICVPLNFLKTEGWKKLLKLHGFDVIETRNLGMNEPLVPEHHLLIIADRIK